MKTGCVRYALVRARSDPVWAHGSCVSVARSVGVKAEFYSVSGKKLKTVTLEHHDNFEIAGKKRAFISRMTIIDELAKDKVTTLDFSAPASLDVPADFFSPDHMAGVKPSH